jgi:alkylhydroperoxidase family enzyme
MGHTEMKLAVAGLSDNAITDLRRRLADGDWSSFRPAERAAFAFARKQANSPDAVTPQDFRQLVEHFGSERAIDVVWWICQCHYMTRIADAFQLPLERENVFDGFLPAKTAKKP